MPYSLQREAIILVDSFDALDEMRQQVFFQNSIPGYTCLTHPSIPPPSKLARFLCVMGKGGSGIDGLGYYLAPKHELDTWLQARREIDIAAHPSLRRCQSWHLLKDVKRFSS